MNIEDRINPWLKTPFDEEIHSNVNDVTLMASFDAETIFRHFDEVARGGGIIYDSDLDKITTDEVHTLDNYFKERLHQELESKNKPFTIAGVLEIAKEKGACEGFSRTKYSDGILPIDTYKKDVDEITNLELMHD